MQVFVTDNSTPSLSDTKSFTMTVNPLGPVTLTSLGITSGQFKVRVNGPIGPDYIIMSSGNLQAGWTDQTTNLVPTTPFQYTDPGALSSTNRFYRVQLSP
ncbi:MAG: hypothetical protein ACLQSR_15980 [Limisphaerales bacterium]